MALGGVALGGGVPGHAHRKLSWTRVGSAGTSHQSDPESKNTTTTTLPQILGSSSTGSSVGTTSLTTSTSPKRDLRKQFRCFQEASIEEIEHTEDEEFKCNEPTTANAPIVSNSRPHTVNTHRVAALKAVAPPPPIPPPLPDKITTILDNLKHERDNIIELENNLKELRKEIKANNKKVGGPEKKAIMDALSTIMERQDDSANLAKIIGLDILLLLKVSKANFGLASKIFFHLASNDMNDQDLFGQGVLDTYLCALGNFCPAKDQDVMLYGYGALKFLSYNPLLLKHMCDSGLIDLIVLHIKFLFQDGGSSLPQKNTILFQMTACLRNCLNLSKGTKSFVNLNGAQLLVSMTNSQVLTSAEVMCNVSRMLSVLSLNEELEQLLEPELIDGALKILEKHDARCDILVRVAFYLGNIAAKDDDSRLFISKHPFMDQRIPSVLMLVLDQLEARDGKAIQKKEAEKAEDAIIKICRIFANVSINSEAGKSVATNETLVRALIRAVGATNVQVVMPILSTLNNLSYYPIVLHGEVYACVRPFVSHEKEGVASEALRVLGNLTRKKEIRDRLRREDDNGFLEYALSRMPVRSEEFRFSAAGVIVNLMTDSGCRAGFRDLGGMRVCLGMLEGIKTSGNWPLGSLVCQILWNYSIHTEKVGEDIEPLDKIELERHLITLLDSSDHKNNNNIKDGEGLEDLEQDGQDEDDEDQYEEFSTVAFHLLSKLYPPQDGSK